MTSALGGLAIVLSSFSAGAQDKPAGVPAKDSLSTVREAPAEVLTQRGFWQMGGIHFGAPTLISASMGVAYGFGPSKPGSVFVDVEPGPIAFRYGGGLLLFEDQVSGIGSAVRVARMQAWRQAFGVRRGSWYTGVEGTLMVMMASLRLGMYASRDGSQATTIDVGVGF